MEQNKLNKILKVVNSTWRPIIVWTLVLAFILNAIIYPVLYMVASFYGKTIHFPSEITSNIFAIIGGLGIFASIRTLEKKFGVTDVH